MWVKNPRARGEQNGMRTSLRHLATVICAVLLLAGHPPANATGFVLRPPVPGRLVHAYESVGTYAAGHRGADLSGNQGERVRAGADGVVRFAGSVAGTPTVSIDHGNGWRTTYQPVVAAVREGQTVRSGDVIGTLLAGHCSLATCLHWGLTDGTRYADPMGYVAAPQIRLVPAGTEPARVEELPAATIAHSVTGLPVAGRRTSPFGMRKHPITGVWKLHDGTDLAAPCGTPIVAPAGGTVTRAYFNAAYGWRVFIDHGGGLVTAYNHLPGLEVRVGDALSAGQRLGSVGSTGLSTGCHLHWMAWRGGSLVDPLTLT